LLLVTNTGGTHPRPVSEKGVNMLAPALHIGNFLGSPAAAAAPPAPTVSREGGFSRLLRRSLQAGAPREAAAAPPARPPQAEGSQWLQQFKAQLQVRGIDCAATAVDQAGLAALLPLLSAAGFDAQAVAGLFAELQSAAGSGDVRLTDLFARLQDGAIDQASASDAEAAALALSSLPYLETVLGAFGMTRADIDQVVAASKSEGRGIALQPLVDALKGRLMADPELAGRVPDPKTRLQIAGLMGRMGLTENGPGAGGALNLAQFVDRLEDLAGLPAAQSTDPADMASQIDRFLEGCRVLAGRAPASAQAVAAPRELPPAEGQIPSVWSSHAAAKLEAPLSAPAAEGAAGAGDAAASLPVKAAANEAAKTAEVLAAAETHSPKPTTGPAGAALAASERSLPAYVLNQVGLQIVRARLNDANEIRFQLKPPHLGRIQLTIDQGPEGLKVTIITEHQAARDMLTAHTADLRASLQGQGLQLDKVDVQVSPNFDQTMADSRRESERGQLGHGRSADRPPEETDSDRGQSPRANRGIRDNALNIVA
jgi:hypothetical protein